MINTISLDEAIQLAPAINAEQPSSCVSNKYCFISTREILNEALKVGWHIRQASQARGGQHAQHSVTLVHNDFLNQHEGSEGFPQLNLINSHNLTKRFVYALGFFRTVCANGLIAPTGMLSSIRTVHRFAEDKKSQFIESLSMAQLGFKSVLESIDNFKNRILTDEEKTAFADFAQYIRFRYRMQQPKKVNALDILAPRRQEDVGNDLWKTFNTIQENMTHGNSRLGRGITQFQDNVRFNQELWSGANAALIYHNDSLKTALKELFPKQDRKKRNTSNSDLVLPN